MRDIYKFGDYSVSEKSYSSNKCRRNSHQFQIALNCYRIEIFSLFTKKSKYKLPLQVRLVNSIVEKLFFSIILHYFKI